MRIRFPGLLSGAVAILLLPISASAGPILCSERADCFAWNADEIGGASGDTREAWLVNGDGVAGPEALRPPAIAEPGLPGESFGGNPFVSQLHEAVATAFASGDGDGFLPDAFAQPMETLSVALAISSTAISEADLPIARVMAALNVNGDTGLPVGELPSPPAPAGGSTPEPATLLLFGTGLFAVRALSGRRRR
ncbi:MAG: PEP-CTERM sorting domain-containing protein [Acidobacteriota bacterium]